MKPVSCGLNDECGQHSAAFSRRDLLAAPIGRLSCKTQGSFCKTQGRFCQLCQLHVGHEVTHEGGNPVATFLFASLSFCDRLCHQHRRSEHQDVTELCFLISIPTGGTLCSTDRELVGQMWSSQQLQLRQQSSAECCTSYSIPMVSYGRQPTLPRPACACPRRAGAWAARTKADSRSQTAAASWVAQHYSSTQPQGVRTASSAPEQPVLPNFWKDSQELGERQLDTGLAPLTKTNLDLMLVLPAGHTAQGSSGTLTLQLTLTLHRLAVILRAAELCSWLTPVWPCSTGRNSFSNRHMEQQHARSA